MVYIPNPRFEAEFSEQEGHDEALEAAAERVKDEAEDFAVRIMPRSAAQQFEVQADEDGVRVVNTDYGSWIAEVGSANSPPYAPLRRGVTSAGYRLEEK